MKQFASAGKNNKLDNGEDSAEMVSKYAWYVAILFAVFFAFSFIDRQIIGVLVPDIKGELGLTDLQLSYVGGLSFVLFYTLFGIPMGRMADIYNRKWLALFGVVVWTVATAACGLASSYWELLILRMGVGLGEAALAPCAYSILADIFPRKRLTIAMSICTMGGAFGFGFAFLGGAVVLGWANGLVGDLGVIQVAVLGELTPWRIVFLAVGVPALCLSVLLLTVKEPLRSGREAGRAGAPSVSQVLAYLRKHWCVFVAIYVGMGCFNLGSYASAFWDITLFERTYGLPPAQSGVYYGIAVTIGQFLGALIGGLATDRVSRKLGRDAKILMLLVIAFSSLWLRVAYPLMPSVTTSLALIFPICLLTGAPFGIAAAALQITAPARMRGQVTAVYFFVQSLIGLGLGPTLVAFLTEVVFEDTGMLRYSLSMVGGLGLTLATLLFYSALRRYPAALTDAQT